MFDPSDIISTLKNIFANTAQLKRINLSLPGDGSRRVLRNGKAETWPLPKLIGDKRRFQQVLINLLKNAFKFTRSGGSISVLPSYDSRTQMLTVDVADTGVGIIAEDFPKLFTRFGKLHRTAEMNSEGIGLGLTIVKQVVRQSNGSIKVFSEGANKGTCFTFKMKMSVEILNNDGQRSSQSSEVMDVVP